MVNVAFIGFFSTQSVNGVTSAAMALAGGLKSLGVQVFFYSECDQTSSTEREGFIFRCFKKGRIPFRVSQDFKNCLNQNPDKIDVFHFQSVFIPFFYPVYKRIHSLGYPYVVNPHGGYEKGVLEKNRVLKKVYIALFESKIVRNAASVICISENERSDVTRIAPKVRTDMISNPVKVPDFSGSYRASTSSGVLLYLGRYDIAHKGLDKLLVIFKEVEKKNQNYSLVLHGEGEDKVALEELAKVLELKNVHIKGPVYGADKIKAIKEATVYVQMSNWEVFGISIVEAMLLNKPVILSSGCALAEFLKEAEGGLVVNSENPAESAEEILKYISDEEKLAGDGAKLKEIALTEFSLEKIAEKMMSLYLEISGSQKNSIQPASDLLEVQS